MKDVDSDITLLEHIKRRLDLLDRMIELYWALICFAAALIIFLFIK